MFSVPPIQVFVRLRQKAARREHRRAPFQCCTTYNTEASSLFIYRIMCTIRRFVDVRRSQSFRDCPCGRIRARSYSCLSVRTHFLDMLVKVVSLALLQY